MECTTRAKSKFRHFATIGAVAIILALGFDPFIQNLIHYETVYLANPRDTNYISSTPVYDYRGTFGDLDSFGKGALSAGLYSTGPATYRVPGYDCSTGNCTWPDYASLALGVHCADLTQQLTQTCSNATNVNSTLGAPCDYSLPNGMNLGNDGRTVLAVNTSREAVVYTNYTNPIAIVQAIGAYQNEYVNASASVSAVECIMFPAVKRYTSSVGSYYTAPWYAAHTEDSTAVGPLGTPDDYFENMLDMHENYDYVFASNNSIEAGYFLRPGPSWASVGPSNGLEVEYRMSNQAVISLQKYIRTLFQGTVRRDSSTAPLTTSAELNGGGSSDALWVTYDQDATFETCKFVPNYWYIFSQHHSVDVYLLTCGRGTLANDAKNIPCALDAMSASFTSMMRQSQNSSVIPGESAVMSWAFSNGKTIAPITQVNVTWPWIILPVIIWFCSIVMVIGTAVKSKRAKVHLWRTNPLAMVFLTLGRDERQEVSQHGGLSEEGLIKRAENIRVKLTTSDGRDIMLRKPRAPE